MPRNYSFKGLAHIAIPTSSIHRSLEFYCGILGFEMVFRGLVGKERKSDPFFPAEYALVRQGSCTLELVQPSDLKLLKTHAASDSGGPLAHFAILVDDIEAAVADLAARGLEFDGSISYFPDIVKGFKGVMTRGPNGELIEVCQLLS